MEVNDTFTFFKRGLILQIAMQWEAWKHTCLHTLISFLVYHLLQSSVLSFGLSLSSCTIHFPDTVWFLLLSVFPACPSSLHVPGFFLSGILLPSLLLFSTVSDSGLCSLPDLIQTFCPFSCWLCLLLWRQGKVVHVNSLTHWVPGIYGRLKNKQKKINE